MHHIGDAPSWHSSIYIDCYYSFVVFGLFLVIPSFQVVFTQIHLVFFEYEAGGTNLAVAISLSVAMLLHFPLSAILSILMLYWIYLFVAGVTHFIF